MKDLKTFLTEVRFSMEKEIEQVAWGVLDYFNQEGVKDWDENDMKKYVNGSKDPDYRPVIDEIIATIDTDKDRDQKSLDFLKDYENNKVEIDDIILKAMKDYIKDL